MEANTYKYIKLNDQMKSSVKLINWKKKSHVENKMIADVFPKTFTVSLHTNNLKVTLGSVTLAWVPSNLRIRLFDFFAC